MGYMTYFNRGGNGGGGFRDNRGGGGRPSFGGGDRDRSQMFQTVCSECGRDCEVPFRPNGSKPVFCSSCFEAQGNGGRPSRSGGFGGGRPDDHTSVRRFEPNGKPIENREERDNRHLIQLKDEVSKLTSKIDQLVEALTPKVAIEEAPKKVKKAKKVEEVVAE